MPASLTSTTTSDAAARTRAESLRWPLPPYTNSPTLTRAKAIGRAIGRSVDVDGELDDLKVDAPLEPAATAMSDIPPGQQTSNHPPTWYVP